MAQIIIALEEKNYAKQIQAKIVQKYGLESVIFQDVSQATSMIGLLTEIQMVISSEKMHIKICEHIIKTSSDDDNREIKVLVIGATNSIYPYLHTVPTTLPIDRLVHQAGFILNLEETTGLLPNMETKAVPVIAAVKKEEDQKTTVFKMPKLSPNVSIEQIADHVEDYAPISSKLFLHLVQLENDFDIYSRLKKGDSYVFNIKVSANAGIPYTELEKIKNRMGKELYVKKADLIKAQNYFHKNFIERFYDSGLKPGDRMVLNSESFDLLVDVFRDSSLSKFSIEIIKELVKSFQIMMKEAESLSIFWNGMKEHDFSYVYIHSHLSCILVLKVIENFEWKKEQSVNKVIYLSIFHDLSLHNNKLVKAHQRQKEEMASLTDSEIEIINNHANAAALILEKIVMAPKELTTIIREHHGIKSGNKFSDDLSVVIGPLNMAFMVIEEFVTRYLSMWDFGNKPVVTEFMNRNMDFIFDELEEKYNKHVYLEVAQALRKNFKKR